MAHTSELHDELTVFAQALAERGVTPNTICNYSGSLRRFAAHLAEAGTGHSPAQASVEDVTGYLAAVGHRPSAYIVNELKGLRAYYDTLARDDNPAQQIPRPSLPTPTGIPWRPGELDQLLETTLARQPGPPETTSPLTARDAVTIQLWVRFQLTTGQLSRLPCTAVDLAQATLTVVPRTRPRVYPLPSALVGLLDDYLTHHRPRLAATTDRLLPAGITREHLDDHDFDRLLARTATTAGLAPPFTAARLRRSLLHRS